MYIYTHTHTYRETDKHSFIRLLTFYTQLEYELLYGAFTASSALKAFLFISLSYYLSLPLSPIHGKNLLYSSLCSYCITTSLIWSSVIPPNVAHKRVVF